MEIPKIIESDGCLLSKDGDVWDFFLWKIYQNQDIGLKKIKITINILFRNIHCQSPDKMPNQRTPLVW